MKSPRQSDNRNMRNVMQKLLPWLVILWVNTTLAATLNPDHDSFVDGEPTSGDFTAIPPFIESASGKPSVIMAFDISGSMLVPAYPVIGSSWSNDTLSNFDPDRTYFGYFESSTQYTYDVDDRVFIADETASRGDSGYWDGDFLTG